MLSLVRDDALNLFIRQVANLADEIADGTVQHLRFPVFIDLHQLFERGGGKFLMRKVHKSVRDASRVTWPSLAKTTCRPWQNPSAAVLCRLETGWPARLPTGAVSGSSSHLLRCAAADRRSREAPPYRRPAERPKPVRSPDSTESSVTKARSAVSHFSARTHWSVSSDSPCWSG